MEKPLGFTRKYLTEYFPIANRSSQFDSHINFYKRQSWYIFQLGLVAIDMQVRYLREMEIDKICISINPQSLLIYSLLGFIKTSVGNMHEINDEA